jgi:hypothetical protein
MPASTNTMVRQMLALSRAGTTVFRNNTGVGWASDRVEHFRQVGTAKLYPGDVIVRGARPLHAGLCKGSSDLIGHTPVLILPEFVGLTLPVFTAVESKDGKATPSKEQKNFIKHVHDAGGLAGVARTDDEALRIVSRYKNKVR